MAFSAGKDSVSLEDIKTKVSDAELVSYYLGVTKIPCFINSPIRKDENPSFGLYSKDGNKICWTDLATREGGGVYDLLSLMWHTNFEGVLTKIHKHLNKFKTSALINSSTPCIVRNIKSYTSDSNLQCKVREWRQYDIDYWASYGVPLKWLKYAEVYPISHKIVTTNGKRYVFSADKLAYAFVERKEGRITLKIYQPLNKNKHKWLNKHDRSTISLWTKVPEYGNNICICSSLKDALCLWANSGIPSIALQGEGYGMSDTAIKELKRRYKNIYILFDNDKDGLADGIKLAERTGFINVTLPKFNKGKDISDLFKSVGKEEFCNIINGLFNTINYEDDLPF